MIDGESNFFDLTWMAVFRPNLVRLLQVLRLSEATTISWERLLNEDTLAEGVYDGTRVFLSPIVKDWILVVGMFFQEPAMKFDMAKELCREVSSGFDKAGIFCTQGRMDLYFWILADSGEIKRSFLWNNGDVLDNEGFITPLELDLMKELSEDIPEGAKIDLTEVFGEEFVMRVAGGFSINPQEENLDGNGLIAATPLLHS